MSAKRRPVVPPPITDEEVEERIQEFFNRNADGLRQEGGHVLSTAAKQQALNQVKMYWRKLKELATSVTETEVKLTLPGQRTPNGRSFVLEGVVDIVRQGERVYLYDLKTHEASEVRAAQDDYEKQLAVYAHLWREQRGQRLDGTAIIATGLPAELRDRTETHASEQALANWEPVVRFEVNEGRIGRIIEEFGHCVDAIEEGRFDPPSPERLKAPWGTRRTRSHGGEQAFAEIHCQTCDARFTCNSYRTYKDLSSRRTRPGR